MKIATAAQIRLCDRLSIEEYGIPGLLLMERAGEGTIAAMVRHFGPLAGKRVLILIGPGNNGGDGLVTARLLLGHQAQPRVLSLVSLQKIAGDAAVNLERLRSTGVEIFACTATDELPILDRLIAESDLLVDALFGTGLNRRLDGIFTVAIERINKSTLPVVALDIPSGLESDSGLSLGSAVRATLTCTYGLPKPAQVQPPGRKYVGRLELIDIGIPTAVIEQLGPLPELLVPAELGPMIPARFDAAHKGSFGHLLILAGSQGKGGAAILCGLGALRSGVGLTTLAAPKQLNGLFQTALPEAMTLPLPFSQQCFSDADLDRILAETAANKKAVVLGPGLGTNEETGRLVHTLARELPLPMLIDADGLNLLAQSPDILVEAAGPRILTPHPGEMARLCRSNTAEVQHNRLALASDFAQKYRVFLILKGAATVLAAPDGRLAVNPSGNPGMAAGGMGDVLAGLAGGLLAQGVNPFDACCLAAYIHGLAGDRLLAAGRPFGFLASELAHEIPAAFNQLLTG